MPRRFVAILLILTVFAAFGGPAAALHLALAHRVAPTGHDQSAPSGPHDHRDCGVCHLIASFGADGALLTNPAAAPFPAAGAIDLGDERAACLAYFPHRGGRDPPATVC